MLKVNNKDTIFADVTKIVAMFIKAIFKTKKVKGIINYKRKCDLYLSFLI